MGLKEILKARYEKLTRDEKEIIGVALVKVNLGVAMPADHRAVAGFVKGTGLVAKSGRLDEIIAAIHQDEEEKKRAEAKKMRGTVSLSRREANLSESVVKKFEVFDEDSEVTVKEKGEKEK
ncbi:MAG: hypothetical protein HY541_07735 [Deltaproteobacteria bacterium]|nr:hypothetical protein [Deltaproteobacteria bacterium]